MGRIIELQKQEQKLKSGITIGMEVPKFIPLKRAAISKEYVNDFTPEELKQFKRDSKIERKVKKVYKGVKYLFLMHLDS